MFTEDPKRMSGWRMSDGEGKDGEGGGEGERWRGPIHQIDQARHSPSFPNDHLINGIGAKSGHARSFDRQTRWNDGHIDRRMYGWRGEAQQHGGMMAGS